VQLLACESTACVHPHLIANYGSCSVEGCIASTAPVEDLLCRGDTCLLVLPIGLDPNAPETPPAFRLLVQVGDRPYQSSVVMAPPISDFGSTYWQVTVTETGLTIEPDQNPGETARRGAFGVNFGFTVCVED
jgi:hypothetical protein